MADTGSVRFPRARVAAAAPPRVRGARSGPGLLVLLLLVPVVSGCFGSDDAAGEPVGTTGTKSSDDSSTTPQKTNTAPAPAPRPTTNGRWHFHNLWNGATSITLLDADIELPAANFTVGAAGSTAGGIEFGLASGSLVPPEAGILTVNITFTPAELLPSTGLQFRYRDANASEPIAAGDPFTTTLTARIEVTEDMTDVPHQGVSSWRFRLDPVPDASGLAFANGTAHVTLVATIGRPVLIDPPHGNPWVLGDELLLADETRTGTFVRAAGTTLLHDGQDVRPAAAVLAAPVRNRSLVPEGAQEVLVELAWSGDVPAGENPFVVTYLESNTPSEGTLAPEMMERGRATYRIDLVGSMVDSPYARSSAWEFRVGLADPGGAFTGTVTLRAWVARDAASPIPPLNAAP